MVQHVLQTDGYITPLHALYIDVSVPCSSTSGYLPFSQLPPVETKLLLSTCCCSEYHHYIISSTTNIFISTFIFCSVGASSSTNIVLGKFCLGEILPAFRL